MDYLKTEDCELATGELMIEANNTDTVEIRLARTSDALELAILRYAFRSDGETIETKDAFVQRCSAWMTERLQSNSWRCWLAGQDGILIGTLWLQLIEKIPNPTSEPEFHAYITNFFVSETARGKGIGSRLLTHALCWCRETAVHAVILWPTERSRSLYERYGFSVRPDLMELLATSRSTPSTTSL